MPELSRFLGIVIGMFYREHGMPHIHAVYGEHEISVEVETGTVHGHFPSRALKLVLEMDEPAHGRIAGGLATGQAGPAPEANCAPGVSVMNYHIVEARYVAGHVVWLRFRDGMCGEIDLKSVLEGPVFDSLHDPQVFRQFQIHPEFHTLVWANGADIAPEFLHDNVRVTA
jgi:Protein of unknown function (DUF2442)/Domain of unknown function (DUF4160)